MDSSTNSDQYIDSAVRAVTNKRPVPEIDFTLHTMEDGTQVSTMDRVCRGMYCSILAQSLPGVYQSYRAHDTLLLFICCEASILYIGPY